MLIFPHDHVIAKAFSLTQGCTDNVARYNVLLIRLQIAWELRVKNLQAYGDSELIVCQAQGEYNVKHENLVLYYNAIIQITEGFLHFYIEHIPCRQNMHADMLALLTASLALPAGESQKVLVFSRNLYFP